MDEAMELLKKIVYETPPLVFYGKYETCIWCDSDLNVLDKSQIFHAPDCLYIAIEKLVKGK